MTLTTQPPTRTTPQPGPRDHPRTRAHTGTADLRALAAGEPDAWTAVIARYQPLVASRARRQHLNPDDTADLMQDTWLRLFENADKVRDPERLPGWVATTASREAFKTRQRSFREQPHADADTDTVDPNAIDCVDRLDAAGRAAALHAAVAQLPTRERRLIEVLLEPDPHSYAQISTRLQMPIGSIGPIRARALTHLRDRLEPHHPPEPSCRGYRTTTTP